jgi:hypothetical protein
MPDDSTGKQKGHSSVGTDPEFSDERQRFEAGERWAVLEVFMSCSVATPQRPVPAWAVIALVEALLEVTRGERTWDDVFVLPWKYDKMDRRRYASEAKIHDIWHRVNALHDEGVPLSDELFERVGREFGLSRATTNGLYYEMLRSLGGRPGPDLLKQIKDLDK